MKAKLFRLLVLICRFALAAMFLLAVGAKLYFLGTPESFTTTVANLAGARFAAPIAYSVIALELLTAILLLVPRTARAGGLLAALMLVGFAGYALFYVYVQKGEPLECGCFGKIIASQLGVSTALRNLVLLIPALLVFFGSKRSSKTAVTTTENILPPENRLATEKL